MNFDVFKTQDCINALSHVQYENFSEIEVNALITYLDDIFEGKESTTTVEDDYRWCLLKAWIKFHFNKTPEQISVSEMERIERDLENEQLKRKKSKQKYAIFMKAFNKAIDDYILSSQGEIKKFLLTLKARHESSSAEEIYRALIFGLLSWKTSYYSAQKEKDKEKDEFSKELQKVLKQNSSLKKQIELLHEDLESLGDLCDNFRQSDR